MRPCTINGRSYLLDRASCALPRMDLISWLAAQPLYPKVFWKERDTHTARAAIGNLLLFPEVPHFSAANPFDMRFYGGIRFNCNQREDVTWRGFPNTCFWLPQIELSQEGDHTEGIVYSLNGSASLENLSQLQAKEKSALPTYSLIERREMPSFEVWQRNVEAVLESIASGQIEKLVLARKTTLQFTSPLSPWPILSHLNEKAKRATLFAFQLSPTLCFLGATPEKLFQRDGNLFNTDAVASTRPRGKTPEEDLAYEKDLLTNGKEQREFKIVKDYLDSALSSLSERREWENQDRVLKASHVQHLHNRLNASLKNAISDADLIRALHPTPALGGFPRERALKLLEDMEPFDRGWYGAPIGTVGQNGASLHVAIRSCLIRNSAVHLFAGTGLVQGSIAEQEWEELEQKIRPFAELFFRS